MRYHARVKFHLPPMPRRAREILLTVLCGMVACLVAIAFGDAIHFLHDRIWHPLAAAGPWTFALGGLAVLATVGLVTGWMLAVWAPDAAGSGIPQLKTAYWRDHGRIGFRTLWVKFLAGSISVGGGMSLGREGPTVQLAAGLCSVLGRRLGAINMEGRALSACGAAAGLAAAFNTPIAAVTFVLEEIIENLNSRLVGRILLASFISVFVLYLAREDDAVLALPETLDFDWQAYLLVVPVAAAAAITGVLFQKAALGWRRRIRSRSRLHPAFRPLVGALATWAAATAVFTATGRIGIIGMGYHDLNACLAGSLGLATIAILLLGKWLATTASYAWGGCGGIFAPTLFLGAFTGSLLASGASSLSGLSEASIPLLAVTGMSACLGAVVRAPATSILIVFEMTHDFALVPPLMLAALVSQFISRRLCPANFYSQVIADDGIDLSPHRTVETFSDWKSKKLAPFATFPAMAIQQDDAAANASLFASPPHTAYPVVDARGILVGVASRQDWLKGDRTPLPATTLPMAATLGEAERALVEAAHGLVVIVDPLGRPLGIFTLHDLLRRQLAIMEDG